MALGRELDNFTYEIANEAELARFLDVAVGIAAADAARYIAELQGDSQLRGAIEATLRGRSDRNRTMPYGRRLGWYAIVRARKPKLVVETGVHDGLGSAVLLRALARNADEGHEGVLVSYDTNRNSGWLIPAFVRSRYQLEIAPAPDAFVETLRGRPVDFFIHDSDHRYEHETAEFEAIWPLAAADAVLLSDNAHAGTAFRDFCDRHGLASTSSVRFPEDTGTQVPALASQAASRRRSTMARCWKKLVLPATLGLGSIAQTTNARYGAVDCALSMLP